MPVGHKPDASSNGSPTKLSSPSSSAYPPLAQAVEDVELDDCLDDNELSDSETLDKESSMGSVYRNGDNNTQGGVKKMSEVANAVSSCLALSFFSISMILANKVRTPLLLLWLPVWFVVGWLAHVCRVIFADLFLIEIDGI